MAEVEKTKRSRGAQPGNKNSLKHGLYTKERILARREERQALLRLMEQLHSLRFNF